MYEESGSRDFGFYGRMQDGDAPMNDNGLISRTRTTAPSSSICKNNSNDLNEKKITIRYELHDPHWLLGGGNLPCPFSLRG
jgi:hypothetical protein